MTELNNPANCERFPFPGCLINLTFKQLVIISRHLVAVSRWPYVRSIHNVIFPRFCGHGVKQLALISRTQLEFYSREKSAVADGYRKSQDSRKYRLWPQLDSGIYDDERAPF